MLCDKLAAMFVTKRVPADPEWAACNPINGFSSRDYFVSTTDLLEIAMVPFVRSPHISRHK